VSKKYVATFPYSFNTCTAGGDSSTHYLLSGLFVTKGAEKMVPIEWKNAPQGGM